MFGKIFLCKSILCVEIPAEAFFVDLGNRLIEIFQMTDSLAGRLAFQNANIFTQHHLPFKMLINVKCIVLIDWNTFDFLYSVISFEWKFYHFNLFPNDHSHHILGCFVIIFQLKIEFIENCFGEYLISFSLEMYRSRTFSAPSVESWPPCQRRIGDCQGWEIHLHEFD